MTNITASRLAMYEGIIALAWADHMLDESEKHTLHALIDGNSHFDDTQRGKLHSDIDQKVALSDVWPHVTDLQDRAHILNMAGYIFLKDGTYCDNERMVYDEFLAKHLDTLDSGAMIEELAEMTHQMRERHKVEAKEMEEYAKQFSIIERIKKYFEDFLT